MAYRFLRFFLIVSAGALWIGMMGFGSARAQDNPNAPRHGKGQGQSTHAKKPQTSIWGTPGKRQTRSKNSLWGDAARNAQPPSPWTAKRNAKGIDVNPPSPWTPSKSAAHRNYGADTPASKGQRQVFRYGNHPAHPGKWTATRSHNTLKSGRWTQNTTPGAWKLKQKASAQNGKAPNGKRKTDSLIQTGLPQK